MVIKTIVLHYYEINNTFKSGGLIRSKMFGQNTYIYAILYPFDKRSILRIENLFKK